MGCAAKTRSCRWDGSTWTLFDRRLTKSPCPGGASKYRTPSTRPLCRPFASSSATPSHVPAARSNSATTGAHEHTSAAGVGEETEGQERWGAKKVGERDMKRERERERERVCVCVCVLNMQTGRIATLVSQEAKGRTVPVFPTKQRVPWPNPSTVTRLPTSLWVKMDATACSTALVMEVRAPKAT